MSIANKAFGAIGPKIFVPEGPLGSNSQFPFPQFDFGEVVKGDKESEFIYLQLVVTAANVQTQNQGDLLVWDNSFSASFAVAAAAQAVVGSGAGTFFLGGRVGDPAAASFIQPLGAPANSFTINPFPPNSFSYTFQPGVYGIWAQRFGSSIVNFGTLTAGDPLTTSTVVGQVVGLATAPTHSAGISNLFPAAPSIAFTANTTNGSNILQGISSGKGLVRGMAVSGAGLNAGCFISDIGVAGITLGNTLNSAILNAAAATATATGVTITAFNGAMWAVFASGSQFAKVSGIYGIYPNQTFSGTGITTGTTLLGIAGNANSQSAVFNAAFTAAETTPVLLTAAGYLEAYLRLPVITSQS